MLQNCAKKLKSWFNHIKRNTVVCISAMMMQQKTILSPSSAMNHIKISKHNSQHKSVNAHVLVFNTAWSTNKLPIWIIKKLSVSTLKQDTNTVALFVIKYLDYYFQLNKIQLHQNYQSWLESLFKSITLYFFYRFSYIIKGDITFFTENSISPLI